MHRLDSCLESWQIICLCGWLIIFTTGLVDGGGFWGWSATAAATVVLVIEVWLLWHGARTERTSLRERAASTPSTDHDARDRAR